MPTTINRRAVARWGFTFIVGGLGGFCFYQLSIPLAWMLGSMFAVMVLALLKAPVELPRNFRDGVMLILAAALGSAFSPDFVSRLMDLAAGAFAMIGFVSCAIVLSVTLFFRAGGFDRATAFFGGTPGGLAPMTLIGEQFGGDGRIIPLVHAVRIVIVVSFVPAYLTFIEGLDLPPRGSMEMADRLINLEESGYLLMAVVAGYTLGKLLRLPSAGFIGPMLSCATLYMTGLVEGGLPFQLVLFAQVVMGATVGVRFYGIDLRSLAKPMALAAISALIILAAAVVFAHITAPLLGVSRPAMLLALAPGGLNEMSLVALSLNIDVAFVATMHVVRILLVVTVAPLVYRLVFHREE